MRASMWQPGLRGLGLAVLAALAPACGGGPPPNTIPLDRVRLGEATFDFEYGLGGRLERIVSTTPDVEQIAEVAWQGDVLTEISTSPIGVGWRYVYGEGGRLDGYEIGVGSVVEQYYFDYEDGRITRVRLVRPPIPEQQVTSFTYDGGELARRCRGSGPQRDCLGFEWPGDDGVALLGPLPGLGRVRDGALSLPFPPYFFEPALDEEGRIERLAPNGPLPEVEVDYAPASAQMGLRILVPRDPTELLNFRAELDRQPHPFHAVLSERYGVTPWR